MYTSHSQTETQSSLILTGDCVRKKNVLPEQNRHNKIVSESKF